MAASAVLAQCTSAWHSEGSAPDCEGGQTGQAGQAEECPVPLNEAFQPQAPQAVQLQSQGMSRVVSRRQGGPGLPDT